MHTILGYKGAIGQAVLRDLQSRNLKHRLISRSANAKIPLEVKADLRYAKETEIAIKGSDFVYLCIGLPYNHKVWEKEWPIIMYNVIDKQNHFLL